MELDEAMRTQHACRYYRDEPAPDEVLCRAVELARFAPQLKSTSTGFRDPARTMADTDAREPEVKELLGIPEHMSTACHIVAGYPARPFPRNLYRPGVSEIAFRNR